jgi:hypothetical protein
MSTFERLPKENRDRRYRQRMFIGNIDETRTITFGRDVHGPARIDARYHDEGAPFDPSLAARIDVIDHLRNLAWNIWPKDRFGLGGTRNPQLGLIHLGSRGGAIYSPGTFGCGTNAKLPTASSNVRVRGLSGSLLLAARFSQFDPHGYRTLLRLGFILRGSPLCACLHRCVGVGKDRSDCQSLRRRGRAQW